MITTANTINSSTFQYWINRTNEMAYNFSTCVVTTDANSSSLAATGNAAITGTFTANGISVGNSTVNTSVNSTSFKISNSTVSFSIPSPTLVQAGNSYVLSSSGTWVYNSTSNGSLSLTGNNTKIIDSYPMAQFSAAEYLLSVIDTQPGANNRYTSVILTTHDTVNGLLTEYASFTTNAALGTFTAGSNTTHVILYFTSSSANASITYNVKFTRTLV